MSATRRGAATGGLAYTVDGQGRVRDVRERMATAVTAAVAAARPPASADPGATLGGLLTPLAWEPVHRLLAWGAREGLTAAELLDTCRAATYPPTTRRQRSAR